MKTLKISSVFDFVFGTAFVFLISFVWSRYFLHDIFLTVFLSGIMTFLIVTIFHLIKKIKYKNKELSNGELKSAQNISTNFLLMTEQQILKEFEKYLSKKYEVKQKSDFIVVNDTILRPIFSCYEITDKEILESYTKTKYMKAKKLIIVCKSYSQKAKQIASIIQEKKVIILDELSAYENIYKPLNFKTTSNIKEIKNKKNINYYIEFALNKDRTKNYFLVSVFMLIASFVLRYNLYYLIFATITTSLALYSHFNKRFNKKKSYL